MNKEIVILGYSGHGQAVKEVATACGDQVVAFLDDVNKKADGTFADIEKFPNAEFVSGFGGAWKRANLREKTGAWTTLIHPSAVVSDTAKIGVGTVVLPKAVINANATVGEQCIINTGAIVEHDNQIGNYVHIGVGALLAGTVTVGDRTWIGIGAVIKNNVTIGPDVNIGAGAVVVKDILEPGTYVGVPARRLPAENE